MFSPVKVYKMTWILMLLSSVPVDISQSRGWWTEKWRSVGDLPARTGGRRRRWRC